jgi:hypothetical protein
LHILELIPEPNDNTVLTHGKSQRKGKACIEIQKAALVKSIKVKLTKCKVRGKIHVEGPIMRF